MAWAGRRYFPGRCRGVFNEHLQPGPKHEDPDRRHEARMTKDAGVVNKRSHAQRACWAPFCPC